MIEVASSLFIEFALSSPFAFLLIVMESSLLASGFSLLGLISRDSFMFLYFHLNFNEKFNLIIIKINHIS
jgi:hypothetical protein